MLLNTNRVIKSYENLRDMRVYKGYKCSFYRWDGEGDVDY